MKIKTKIRAGVSSRCGGRCGGSGRCGGTDRCSGGGLYPTLPNQYDY